MSLLPSLPGSGKSPATYIRDNDVDGDVVLGNKTTNNHSVVIRLGGMDIDAILAILKQIEREVEIGARCNSLIGKFDHYFNYEDERPLRSVEEKLRAGDRGSDAELRNAIEDKEYFRRTLDKYMFFKSAQKLFAHFLDHVYHEYREKVYPLIKAEASKEEVDAVIQSSIVEPVSQALIASDDFLGVSTAKGMLMFLTQKCIVDWD